MSKVFDGYVRVSRVAGREGDSFISPDVQRDAIKSYAKTYGYKLGVIHEELDKSGADATRPAWNTALDRVESGESAGIIVKSIDRFARSTKDALGAIDRLANAGGALVAIDQRIDTSDTNPTGTLMRTIFLALAQFERDRIKVSLHEAVERAVDRGVHVSSIPPLGYVRTTHSYLDLDPVRAPLVREAFLRCAGGESLTDVAEWLSGQGMTTQYGKVVKRSTVARMIQNPVYTGEARWGELTNGDAHPAIVTPDEWDAANRVRGQSVSRTSHDALLGGGLIRCSACGYALRHSASKHGRRYDCVAKHANGTCPAPASIQAEMIEGWVKDRVFERVEAPGFSASVSQDELVAAVAQLDRAEAELAAFQELSDVLELGKDAFVANVNRRAAAVEAARDRVAELRNDAELQGRVSFDTTLAEEWDGLEVADRRYIIGSLIDTVVVRRAGGRGSRVAIADRTHIYWAGQAPAGLPSRGRPAASLQPCWPAERDGHAGVAASKDAKRRKVKRA